ncbi:MAG TPA: ATP-binding protein [Candidatus Binataceae bacterium]|nr:ATP-binding protein [Candidatus Binataceae bacterium]
MKVGTRLAVGLLAALTPVVSVYTYNRIRTSTKIFEHDLKRETRATELALNAAIQLDIQRSEWSDINSVLRTISEQGMAVAVLDKAGRLWYALKDFPVQLPPAEEVLAEVRATGSSEFTQTANGRYWFCRIAPMGHDPTFGYLLVAQDWTEVRHDLYRRTESSISAGIVVVLLTAILIPLVARRYVSLPLAELSRRVSSLSTGEESERELTGDEVTLITEEFRKLARELSVARRRLLDENERKIELERRLRHSDKLATIGTLASGLAHEIGTPLGVIRGRAEHLLRSDPDQQKLTQGLEIIINQIDRITRIVRMLLDFGRRREPIRVTSDVRSIVQRTLHLLETEAERRNIRLVSELGQAPLLVDCDIDQLQQVFVNLGMNALDAMAPTGGVLRVSAQRRMADGREQVRLCFEDDGMGVAQEFKDRVFDPFFTTKDPGKGTGMGLAVSQSIVRDHDGEITLEARPLGACFVVTLALSDRRETELAASA